MLIYAILDCRMTNVAYMWLISGCNFVKQGMLVLRSVIFLYIKDGLNFFLQIEDNINIFVNTRQPPKDAT